MRRIIDLGKTNRIIKYIAKERFNIEIKCICQYCGNEYYVQESQLRRTKFCSESCFRKSKNTRVDYRCDYCGKNFRVPYIKYKRKQNGEIKNLYCCSQCAKDAQKPKYDDIKLEFEERGYILCDDKYINAKTKLKYLCRKHIDKGYQFITYNNIRYGYGCKYCGLERQASKRRLSFDDVKKIFSDHDMELLDQEYFNTSQKLKYICKNHKEYGIQYMCTTDAYKQHCPHCNTIKGEKKIADFLIKNNIEFETQKKYDDLLGLKNGKLSYDFYLPTYNILIEYQGQFHDGSARLQTEEGFKTQQQHDIMKKEYAHNHGIELIEIWYKEFDKINEILSEKLLQ